METYFEEVKALDLELKIHRAYLTEAITYDEMNILFEYSMAENKRALGRKCKGIAKGFSDIIKDEFAKAIKDWTTKGWIKKGSATGRIVGITLAGAVQIVNVLAVGPIRWGTIAAATLVSIPAKDFDVPVLKPLYRTNTEPLINMVKNRHINTCKKLAETATSINDRTKEVKEKLNKKELTEEAAQNEINKIMRDIECLANNITKEANKIQKDIDDTAIKMNKIKDSRQGVTDGSNEYHKLKHKKEGYEKIKEKLDKIPKTKDEIDKMDNKTDNK